VYNHFQLGFKYLRYYLTASNGKGHGTHSPFIFHFINKILNDKKHYPAYDKVESLRSRLLKDGTILMIEDYGAGSSVSKTNKRTVASIAKNAAKPKKFGQLLFRMVKEYQPKTILELGTSLGITTSYLSLARPEANIITMEGAGEVAAKASRNFKESGSGNVTIEQGDFDKSLSSVINGLSSVDFVFIDGNHRQVPTEKYFCQLLSKSDSDSIFIFDDIHWSKEMEAAWETIKNHPLVRCTADLFFIGIVFFRPEFHEKQHFVIRY
jgi:hypothetical protein